MNITRIEIEHLAKELENRKHEKLKTVLILGSKAGALSRSTKFLDDMYFLSSKMSLSTGEQFSEAYATLKVEKDKNSFDDIRILLTGAIGNSMYATEDTSLAELVKQNIFNTVFSLSMDDLLYNAFIVCEMKQHQHFEDFALGHWQPEYIIQEILTHKRANVCQLIRLYRDEQAFIYGLNDSKVHAENSRVIKQLLEKWRVEELLIVGWETAWDNILLSSLPGSLKTIWFVNENERTKDAFLDQYQSCENFYYIRTTYKGFCTGLLTQIAPDFISLYEFSRTALHDMNAIRSEIHRVQNTIEQTQKKLEQIQHTITSTREDISNELMRMQQEMHNLKQTVEKLASRGDKDDKR